MAAIELLDSENADRDLTSQVTVLTDTPDASAARVCQAVIQLGDGTLDLDGTGGLFEIEILVGGNTVNGGVEYQKVGTAVRTSLQSQQFLVPANAQVLIKLKSPNGADTNVDVTCYLYDVGPAVIASDIFSRLLMVDTTIATLSSQTSFTLTAGSADDDAYNGLTIVIEDASTSEQKAVGVVDDYTGSTRTVTLLEDPGVFTMAATDKVYILAEKSVKPDTAANYHLGIDANGNVEASNPVVLQEATIDSLTSQTIFTIDAGSSDNDAYNGMIVVIQDDCCAEQKCVGFINDYNGSTRQITLEADPGIFTIAVNDTVKIVAVGDATTAIADAILQRNVSNVEGTAPEHCLATIVLQALESAVSGNTMTIYQTDGVTTHATKTLTKTAGDAPIRGIA